MHLFNFKDGNFISREVDPSLGAKMIHWLPSNEKNVKVKVLMEDGTWIEGLGEPALKKISKNEVVQFERFGFVKLDDKNEKSLLFWFLHK